MNQDSIRKTDVNPSVGHNLARAGRTDTFFEKEKAIRLIFDDWYKERLNCTQELIDKYPKKTYKHSQIFKNKKSEKYLTLMVLLIL